MIASQIKEKPGTKQAKPETYLLFSDFYKNWKPNAINRKIHKLQWTPKQVFWHKKQKADLINSQNHEIENSMPPS